MEVEGSVYTSTTRLREHCNGAGTGPGHGQARDRGGSTGAGREQGEGTAGAQVGREKKG